MASPEQSPAVESVVPILLIIAGQLQGLGARSSLECTARRRSGIVRHVDRDSVVTVGRNHHWDSGAARTAGLDGSRWYWTIAEGSNPHCESTFEKEMGGG